MTLTEEQVHRLVDPPTEQDEERHPKQRELNAEVNGAGFGELLWFEGFTTEDVVEERVCEVGDGNDAVCGEGDDWEEDEAEPSVNTYGGQQ